jgi:hypothetical protein
MSAPPQPQQRSYLHEVSWFEWHEFRWTTATRSAIAITICLAAGLISGHPGGGMVSAAGAFTAGMGSFQRIGRSCILPMFLASIATPISTGIGMVLGNQTVWFVFVAGIWALGYGLLAESAGGTSWVGQKCVFGLLGGSAFHVSAIAALPRCLLMLAGGMLQTGITTAVIYLTPDKPGAFRPKTAPFLDPMLRRQIGGWHRCFTLRSPGCVYAFRQALTVGVAVEIYRRMGIPSGYWIGMTALLVLKSGFRQTMVRGIARVSGTLLGAGIAGVIATFLHLSPLTLSVLVVIFAWAAISVTNVNYALFVLNLTAYIAFLLALNGLPPTEVIHRRALCTALGGVLAILAHLDVLRRGNPAT